ncbi:ATP-binding SpoIIE family protein phosphatase [Streptomyces sp. NPDC052012]|uniref:ATP-binding SpoIIE family protein phosphatase n=1 Tax=Streptomyces sp. NPDC052012 TaxID=3155051 RepID=UPI00344EF44B
MGAIPTQRETASRAADLRACARADATLSGSSLAPGSARALVRAALTEWAEQRLPGAEHLTARTVEDATLIASELVTNAVVHAGTDVQLTCRLEDDTGALVVEVADRYPSSAPRDGEAATAAAQEPGEFGRGLRLVAALSEAWGITYRPGTKTVWARLPAGGRTTSEGTEAYAEDRAPGRDTQPANLLAPESAADATGLLVSGQAADATGLLASESVADTAEPLASESVAGSTELLASGPAADATDLLASESVAGSTELLASGPAADATGLLASGPAADATGLLASESAAGTTNLLAPEPTNGTADHVTPARAQGDWADWTDWPPRASSGAAGAGGSVPAVGGASEPGRSAQTAAQGGAGAEGWTQAGRGVIAPGGRPQAQPPGAGFADDWLAGRTRRDGAWLGRGALSFLAEASDLLAGQLDEDLVAALTGQLIVPRLADWCAVWLEDETSGHGGWGGDAWTGGARLARVWHTSEHRIEELRAALDQNPPEPPDPSGAGPAPYPWPEKALDAPAGTDPGSGVAEPPGAPGVALAYRLVAGGRPLGTLVIGRGAIERFPDEITGLVEDLSRRVALAIGAARQYARQATISAVLQRGLLPGAVAEIPGVRSALVYEPCDKGGPSGDFYDLFPAGRGRWCFALGDVQGKGPEAAVVIGLARPWLRLLAREGYRVADVLDRLNQLLLDDATEAADAAARALVAAGARPTVPGDGPQTRFLSLLYGELVPHDGGVRCTLASAGHPLPLLLAPDGTVRTVAEPQTLLGVVEDATYTSETCELRPGDSLLCVTDGVTERRSGTRQFDDGDGLATALASCAGLDAEPIAERITRLVHEFGARPPADDLALLVLQAERQA